jgi:hypothetical protein
MRLPVPVILKWPPPFETRKPDIDYPCMTGDIEKAAGLTVYEPDDGVVHFARWRPFNQNAVSRSAILPPAREEDGGGRGVAADTIDRHSSPKRAAQE